MRRLTSIWTVIEDAIRRTSVRRRQVVLSICTQTQFSHPIFLFKKSLVHTDNVFGFLLPFGKTSVTPGLAWTHERYSSSVIEATHLGKG